MPMPMVGSQAPRRRLMPQGLSARAPVGTDAIQMQGDVPPGGYNDPANAPPVPGALPPAPRPGQPFSVGKGFQNHQQIPGVQDPIGHAPVTMPTSTSPTTATPITTTPPYTRPTTISPVAPPTRRAFEANAPDFGPGNDMRFKTVMPGQSSRLTAVGGMVDRAASNVAGGNVDADTRRNTADFTSHLATPDVNFRGVDTDVGAGPAVDPTVSGDLAAYRAQQRAAADKLTGGPSRTDLVQREMDAFDASGASKVKDLEREVLQRASAGGRIGMGETELQASKPYTDYLLEREVKKAELASRVAEGEVADRQNNLTATRGLVGDQYSQDAGTRGEQRTERSNVQDTAAANLARRATERNVGLDVATGNVNRSAAAKAGGLSAGISAANASDASRRATLSALGALEGDVDTSGRADRAETRTERGYQTDTANKALDDSIRQRLIEDQETGQDFGQNLSLAQFASGVNPGAVNAGAASAGNTAATSYEALQKLLQSYYANQGSR
jgi:hypothetical protein